MKKIEEEYQNHKLPDDIGETIVDPYCFVLKVEGLIKKMEKEQMKLFRRMIRNKIAKKFFISERDLLQLEENYLSEWYDDIDDNLELLAKTLETLTEENFPELLKVVDFLVVHYLENKGYIAGRIESLNQSVLGLTYIDNRYENTHPAVKEFLSKKLEAMKKKKELEKATKI